MANSCQAITTNPFEKSHNLAYNSYKNKIIELCDSYVENNNLFRYGYKHSAFRKDVCPINERYEINCSTFSMLIALGISFENSKYRGSNNDGIFKDRYSQEISEWFSDSGKAKFSYDLAYKMYSDGHCFIPNEDFSNVETGDILFFNLNPSNDTHNSYFMGIDHSAIFGYGFGDKFLIYEVGDDKGPQNVPKSKNIINKVVLVGRMPHSDAKLLKPRVLKKNEAKKKIDVHIDADSNYNITEIHFKSPLLKGQAYTFFIEVDLDKNLWLNATYNQTSLYALDMSSAKDYRPEDGCYLLHFTAPEDINTLYINVRSNKSGEYIISYQKYALYEGFVTPIKN